ncbi:MAG: protein phosphatase 2C domain-containing protein, partial [Clostridia bacterium]|nr:protein phosphatase 2C domain-containing protein [Clostridia bacterium]
MITGTVTVCTRHGLHHTVSEDAVLVGDIVLSDGAGSFPLSDDGFVCLADGVGGNRGGAKASDFVLKALAGKLPEGADDLKAMLLSVNDDLIREGNASGCSRMATTLTGICRTGDRFYLIHIGNTRACIKQGRYFKQITTDHTTYQLLKLLGRTDEAESCNKSELSNCFGGGNAAYAARLSVTEITPAKRIMLTSDGVHDAVSLDDLEEIEGNTESPEAACEAIL